jgi:hypothetical protein
MVARHFKKSASASTVISCSRKEASSMTTPPLRDRFTRPACGHDTTQRSFRREDCGKTKESSRKHGRYLDEGALGGTGRSVVQCNMHV